MASIISDAQQPTDAPESPAPLIFPIEVRATDEKGCEHRRTSPRSEKARKPRAASQERFAFPELPPATASVGSESNSHSNLKLDGKTSNVIVWPKCDGAAIARACAELATAVLWRLASNRSTVLALVSPGDGDGKTGLLTALAPELARRTGGGVLAVDADFRKADLTRRLTIPDAANIGGDAPLIYPTDQPGLYVRPLYREQYAGNNLYGCLDQWRERWPLILLDVPSLEHAEPAPLLRRCDGAYLIVRLGHTAHRAVSEAAGVVRTRGGRLLGCVVVG
jgi:Mrp family chromosome partitioning ATPase